MSLLVAALSRLVFRFACVAPRSFPALALVALASVVPSGVVGAQLARSTITFVNSSGQAARVKLVGPSEQAVEVPNGQSRTVEASAGTYYILTRYGDAPNTYSYSKGNSFAVTETSSEASIITITLHKVIGGNYGTRPVSAREFDLPRKP